MLIIEILLIFVIATIFHLLGSFIFCRIFKINVEAIQLFYGKAILEYTIKDLKFALGYIPTGGFVKFDREDFETRNLLTRSAITVSGALFIFLSAAVITGLADAFNELVKGFPQIVNILLSPLGKGSEAINAFNKFTVINNFPVSYALLATKIAAANLLPIPPLNGGQFFIELLPPFKEIKRKVAATNIGFILLILLVIYGLIRDLLPHGKTTGDGLEIIFKVIVQFGLWIPFVIFDLIIPIFLFKKLKEEELKNDYKKRKEHRVFSTIALIIFGSITTAFGYAFNPLFYLANIPIVLFIIIFIIRK